MKPRVAALALFSLIAVTAVQAAENQLSAAEKNAGWQLLFDGKTTQGWRPYAKTPFAGWEVQDGALHAIAGVKGSALITEKQFGDFEFAWDWKVPLKGNNGVKYFVTEARTKSPGPEYQMIDDERHPDGKRGPLYQTAAYYDVLPAPADKPLRPPGEWNTSRIVAKGKHVEHWLNGKKVLEFEVDSPEVKAGIARSKFSKEVGFGEHIVGHIMLTYHSDDCWFRNIKIRELK
ncbi:MAG: hypothetical protein RIQ93_3259 [Verrucomicrobiota bacterium]|jgi:hypothetical protein